MSGLTVETVRYLTNLYTSDPEVLLLDEPFSNLDELTREKVRTEIYELIKKVGITTILVTHHPMDAFMMADKVAMMKEGKILQLGKPEEVYQHPDSDYTAIFLGASVIIPGVKNGNQVDTPFGKLEKAIAQDTTLFIRPENIRLSDSDGQLSGQITTKLFNGPHEVLVIKNKNGEHKILVETEHSNFKVGERST
ncbi:MAG: TOBE domain-containing protein [Cytophagales bacterium]|nr:TOBE domain-containing protein [Cytophagales bacterium]